MAVMVTDASGIHGVGGYAVVSSRPSVVWLVSEWWPDEILAALAEMATPQVQRAGGLRLAMPSAEQRAVWGGSSGRRPAVVGLPSHSDCCGRLFAGGARTECLHFQLGADA